MRKNLQILFTAAISAIVAPGTAPAFDAGTTYQARCAPCHSKDGKGKPAVVKFLGTETGALDLTDGETRSKSDDELRAATTNGRSRMPSYKNKLSESEVSDLIRYVRRFRGAPAAPRKNTVPSPKTAQPAPAPDKASAAEEVKEPSAEAAKEPPAEAANEPPAEAAKEPPAEAAKEPPAEAAKAPSADLETGKTVFMNKCKSCHGADAKGNPGMAKIFGGLPALDLRDAATRGKSAGDLVSVTTNGFKKMPSFKSKLSVEEISNVVGYMRSLGQ